MKYDEQVKAVQNLFDTVADRYDANRFFPISAAHLIRHADLNACTAMLDLSTGTGNVAMAAAHATDGKMAIDAVDISEKMLSEARKKCEAAGMNCIRFTQMDAHDLKFEPESFERITCGYGLFFFPDMDAVLQNIMGLLKPGGKFVFSSFTEKAFMPQSKHFIDLLETYGIEVKAPSGNLLENEANIRSFCNGYPSGRIEIRTEQIRYPISPEQWWANLESAGYRKFLEELGERIGSFKEEHLAEVARLAGPDGLELVTDSYYTIITKG